MRVRAGRAVPLAGVMLGLVVGVAVASTTARAKAASTTVAARGVLRRDDLGPGFSQKTPAPKHPTALGCRSNRKILAADGSPTWSQPGNGAFVSNASYGFVSATAARTAWSHETLAVIGHCLERQLDEGSGHGVSLAASGVRQLAAPRLPGSLSGVQLRRYRVVGTASGDGQQLPVTLDVILAERGEWIGEDQFSAIDALPAAAAERSALVDQLRQLVAGKH
jgi:hypothetical protein